MNITRKDKSSSDINESKFLDTDANQILDAIQDGDKEIKTMGLGLDPQIGSASLSNNTVFIDSSDSYKLKFKDNAGIVTDVGSGSSSLDIVYTCSTLIAVGNAVYISSADTVDLASNTTLSTTPCVGIVVNKPTTTTCTVRSMGVITGLVGLSEGSKYYLGTSGGVTTTAPTGSGSAVQLVGVSKNSTTLLLTLSYAVIQNT